MLWEVEPRADGAATLAGAYSKGEAAGRECGCQASYVGRAALRPDSLAGGKPAGWLRVGMLREVNRGLTGLLRSLAPTAPTANFQQSKAAEATGAVNKGDATGRECGCQASYNVGRAA